MVYIFFSFFFWYFSTPFYVKSLYISANNACNVGVREIQEFLSLGTQLLNKYYSF